MIVNNSDVLIKLEDRHVDYDWAMRDIIMHWDNGYD